MGLGEDRKRYEFLLGLEMRLIAEAAMGLDIEELQFIGMVSSVAEREMSGSTTDDEGQKFSRALYQLYYEAGKPKNKRDWIKHELKKHFLFVSKPPEWIEHNTVPTWPFFQGRPMVFIEQLSVPDNEISRVAASPDVVLYVFGSRNPVPDVPNGWESVYRVVEQVRDL
jgi:hypothetical protein